MKDIFKECGKISGKWVSNDFNVKWKVRIMLKLMKGGNM